MQPKGSLVRLVAHERRAVSALRKRVTTETQWLLEASMRLQRSKYLFRRKADRKREYRTKARAGPFITYFDWELMPKEMKAVEGILFSSRQMCSEMQDALIRENLVVTRPSVKYRDLVAMRKDPLSLTWTLNDLERKVFDHARRLRVPLNHPLEVHALAQALLQRPKQNIHSLEICFLSASEKELTDEAARKKLPTKFWEKLEVALQLLRRVPAEMVTFTCLEFGPEIQGVYERQGRRLDKRAMLSGLNAELHPRIKELCTPISEEMVQLAKELATKSMQTPLVNVNNKRRREDEDNVDLNQDIVGTQPAPPKDGVETRAGKRRRLEKAALGNKATTTSSASRVYPSSVVLPPRATKILGAVKRALARGPPDVDGRDHESSDRSHTSIWAEQQGCSTAQQNSGGTQRGHETMIGATRPSSNANEGAISKSMPNAQLKRKLDMHEKADELHELIQSDPDAGRTRKRRRSQPEPTAASVSETGLEAAEDEHAPHPIPPNTGSRKRVASSEAELDARPNKRARSSLETIQMDQEKDRAEETAADEGFLLGGQSQV